MNHQAMTAMTTVIDLPIRKYLIVGSYALGNRYAKDIDVICFRDDIDVPPEEVTEYPHTCSFKWHGRKVECLLADTQESLKWLSGRGQDIASPEILYILKAGHIIFPHKEWDKHIADYHYLRNILGSRINEYFVTEMIKMHRETTKERIGKGTPKLIGITKDQFFDDKVIKYFVHDDIHKVMAHKEKPMYTYMQKDENIVECSKELWNGFTDIMKNQCVMEEAYVIALEREIIPTIMGAKVGKNHHEAFKWALMRICTTLCSGWFREYAINNYFTILNTYDHEYHKKFFAALENNKIQPLKQLT